MVGLHGCSTPPSNLVEPVVVKPVRTCWVLPVRSFRFGSNLLNLFEPFRTFSSPIPKTSSSQKRSHRNSVQNGPIERSTALTGTIFVTISVFMSRGHFRTTFGKKIASWRLGFLPGCPAKTDFDLPGYKFLPGCPFRVARLLARLLSTGQYSSESWCKGWRLLESWSGVLPFGILAFWSPGI